MTSLIGLAITELPNILQFLRDLHAKANPGAPAITDDEAKAALLTAVASSVAKDTAWIDAHPV